MAEMDRRLDPLSPAPLAVGFSGGGDSLALLLLARAWAARCGRPVVAFTVDHGLHPASADWTLAAGEVARGLGLRWEGLAWRGEKPVNGLPAAARRARHALLAEATRGAGARVLLLGHTADDIAESELIRLATPSHGRLRPWGPSSAWPQGRELFLLRPLLGLRREGLRAWLSGQGWSWLDDPANADPRFARSRARASLAAQAAASASATGLDPADMAYDKAFASLAQALHVHPSGALELSRDALVSSACAPEGLARMLACVSGGDRTPRRGALDTLVARLSSSEGFVATLAGARLEAEGSRVRLARERGRRPPPPLDLSEGAPAVFDGRFELTAEAPGWGVAALAGHAAALGPSEQAWVQAAPAAARPSLPILLGPHGEVRLPRPFGRGPAWAHNLISGRIAAAFGLIADEQALERRLRRLTPVAQGARSSYLDQGG